MYMKYLIYGNVTLCVKSVEGCRGRSSTRVNLRIQFLHHHVRDKIVIMGEGNCPHPLCPACEIFVTWETTNKRHPKTVIYTGERKGSVDV